MTKRFGFTLAEVLITLGIIGVVAAMTIPTLISNTNGAQFKTAYKKALSTLNQAVLMNLAMDDTDFSTIVDDADAANGVSMAEILTSRMQSATEITNTYTFPSDGMDINVTVDCTQAMITAANAADAPASPCKGKTIPSGETTIEATGAMNFALNSTDYKVYSFADGTSFGFNVHAEQCRTAGAENCVGFIDVNGANNPNTVIECDDAANNVCESSEITDIFPVIFHGQTVEPATDSARAVLFGK